MHVVSLFDYTGALVQPWLENGYECWIIDTQHPDAFDTGGVSTDGMLHRVKHDLSRPWFPPFDRHEIAFVAAFPPCDHLSVSGARWFAGKGLRMLSKSIELFATAAEFCEWSQAPYFIENPVSTISSYWREPNYRFHPHEYTAYCRADNYTKQTCLWTGGGFVMPPARIASGLDAPDDRIHKAAPSPERANLRSKTPSGFALAAYLANSGHQGYELPEVVEEKIEHQQRLFG